MKKALFTAIALTGTLLSGYFGYFYITPNVTVVNASSQRLTSFVVTLPNSRLDFGDLDAGETNTIYYSIGQTDGYYSVMVIMLDGRELKKNCGLVRRNEIHKRVTISLSEAHELTCLAG